LLSREVFDLDVLLQMEREQAPDERRGLPG
jgi:hypothetical protein